MRSACRIGLVQLCTPDTPAAGLAHALPLLDAAADAGAQLLVTPETCNFMERDPRRQADIAGSPQNEAFLAGMREFACDRRVWLLLGSVVLPAGGKCVNRSLLIDPQGAVAGQYDKIHLFDVDVDGERRHRESAQYAPGGEARVCSTPWGQLGLSICYDLRFPELYRDLAMAGARMIAAPAAFTETTGAAHWEILVRARAIETGAFVLAPAQGGAHADGTRTWGRSMIVSPWGDVVAALANSSPALLVADLDLGRVEHARSSIPALANRRPYRAPASAEGPVSFGA